MTGTAPNLRALQAQLAHAEQKLRAAENNRRQTAAAVNRLRHKVRSLWALIDKANVDTVPVSDHAMLRYLERVHGLDLDAVREAIVTSNVAKAARVLKTAKVPIAGGYRARLKDGVVVTVLPGKKTGVSQ